LTDERLQQLDKFGSQLYKGVVEYYCIRLIAAPEGFAIDLTDAVRRKLPKAHMFYREKNRAADWPRLTPRLSSLLLLFGRVILQQFLHGLVQILLVLFLLRAGVNSLARTSSPD
jgi:hypothetical protein